MITIRTRLSRAGRDSIYSWSDMTPGAAVALQGALLGVLQGTHQYTLAQVGGVLPFQEPGFVDVTLTMHIEVGGQPWYSQATTYHNLNPHEDQLVRGLLSDAVRPFRELADRKKERKA